MAAPVLCAVNDSGYDSTVNEDEVQAMRGGHFQEQTAIVRIDAFRG